MLVHESAVARRPHNSCDLHDADSLLQFAPVQSASWAVASQAIACQPPNGNGPRCSAIGPSAAIGRNNSAPTIRMTPSIRNANVGVSSRKVPNPNGADFL